MHSRRLWAGALLVRRLSLFAALGAVCGTLSAQIAGTALTNRVTGISGRIEGSV